MNDTSMNVTWTMGSFASTLAMWTVMMVGMMAPSAAALLRGVASSNRYTVPAPGGARPLVLVGAGYVAAWTAFSLFATVTQLMLRSAMELSPNLAFVDPRLAALTLIGAGLYEMTPFKGACLALCRAPLGLLLQHSKRGLAGAILTGLDHGVTCVACCWPLMLVLFVVGVMNVPWVILLAVVVAFEKLAGAERWPRRLVGIGLVAWGVATLVTPFAHFHV
jgi:predicted metal-binding membrane protein